MLLDAALAGRSRAGDPGPTGTPVDDLASHLKSESLLLRAGLLETYRRAGYRALDAMAPFTASPDEPLPYCPPLAAAAVREMLAHRLNQPLIEAFRALRSAGFVLPPDLLTLALETKIQIPEMAAVLGERGRWLAGLNPAWNWALGAEVPQVLPSDHERLWQEGTKQERVNLLRLHRRLDPAAARERLRTSLPGEPAPSRAALLQALEENLSGADEPLLEAALDDRAQTVRAVAASLLARLPESALMDRMRERAATWLPRLLATKPAVLQLPESLEPYWARDGIGDQPPPGINERVWWVVQLCATLPPSELEQRFGTPVGSLITSFPDRLGAHELLRAWGGSAIEAHDSAMLDQLWDGWWARRDAKAGGPFEGVLLLAPHVLSARAERSLSRVARDIPLAESQYLLELLLVLPAPWTDETSTWVLDLHHRHARKASVKEPLPEWVAALWRPISERIAIRSITYAQALLQEAAPSMPWNYKSQVSSWERNLEARRQFWETMQDIEPPAKKRRFWR